MARDKKGSGPDIGSYFDSGVVKKQPEAENVPQSKTAVKSGKKLPTSFRVDDGYLENLRILSWKLRMPSFTATANRAFKEFIENHRDALDEAKAQLGEEGIRELLSRKG